MLTGSFILWSVFTLLPHPQEPPATIKRTRPDKQPQMSSVQKSAISALEPLLETYDSRT